VLLPLAIAFSTTFLLLLKSLFLFATGVAIRGRDLIDETERKKEASQHGTLILILVPVLLVLIYSLEWAGQKRADNLRHVEPISRTIATESPPPPLAALPDPQVTGSIPRLSLNDPVAPETAASLAPNPSGLYESRVNSAVAEDERSRESATADIFEPASAPQSNRTIAEAEELSREHNATDQTGSYQPASVAFESTDESTRSSIDDVSGAASASRSVPAIPGSTTRLSTESSLPKPGGRRRGAMQNALKPTSKKSRLHHAEQDDRPHAQRIGSNRRKDSLAQATVSTSPISSARPDFYNPAP